jgi:hypothetical protein
MEGDPQIRVIVNDGVVPLDNLEGCPENPHGMWSIQAFVDVQRENIRSTDWDFVCDADWSVPDGWKLSLAILLFRFIALALVHLVLQSQLLSIVVLMNGQSHSSVLAGLPSL